MSNTQVSVVINTKKSLKFTITEKSTGAAVDLTNYSAALKVYNSGGTLFSKTNAQFDRTLVTTGILKVQCTFSTAGVYNGLLTLTSATSGDIDPIPFGVTILAE